MISKRKGKGLVPQPDILLLLVATPLLLTLVFVITPVLQQLAAGTISMEVNMKRMYYPLRSENTLTSLLNSEFEGKRMSKMIKYHMYYEGDFKVNGKMVNNTLKKYLDNLVHPPEYLLLMNTTDFEENISSGTMGDLKRAESYVSKINFRTPSLEEAKVELRLPKG